jgi:hypothetical protein
VKQLNLPILWKKFAIKEAIHLIRTSRLWNGLMPLFNDPDTIFRLLEQYRPDIIYFKGKKAYERRERC